jgi:cell division septum initiation protein DivIVA
MALVGYQVERQKIEEKISELQAKLKGKHVGVSSPAAGGGTRSKRVLSPAARARIAAAQRKRWAEHRKREAAATRAASKGE